MKFTKHTIYIGLFAILYLIVAFSSFWHACAFFGLANNTWMSIILAFAFEIGQAAVLFSLLTSKRDRGRIMPWVLMSMFTLVQVIGNVFSSYKYIITNSIENLKYFKEPIFIWTTLPDDQATVIIVYIVGAILPICALLLTSMITNYLSDIEESKNSNMGISEETKDKLNTMLNTALDNTSEKELNEILDEKEQHNKEIDEQKVEKSVDTDHNGEVISEQGNNSSNFISTKTTNEDLENLMKKELNKLKNDLKQSKKDDLIKPFNELNKENNNKEKIKNNNNESNDKKLLNLEDNKQSTIGLDQNVQEKNIDVHQQINSNPKSELEIKEIEQDNDDEDIELDNNIKVADALMGGNILNKQRVQKDSHFINNEKNS